MTKEDEIRLEFILNCSETGVPIQLTEKDQQLLKQLEALIKLNLDNFG
jgi:hypothetical protein